MKYLFFLLLLVACSKKEPAVISNSNTKFQVGDCVTNTFEYTDGDSDNEFLTARTETITIYNKILKIGKKNYLVDIGSGILKEKEISDVDQAYTKIDCSEFNLQ